MAHSLQPRPVPPAVAPTRAAWPVARCVRPQSRFPTRTVQQQHHPLCAPAAASSEPAPSSDGPSPSGQTTTGGAAPAPGAAGAAAPPAAALVAPGTAAAAAAATAPPVAPMTMLKGAEPMDRLRYQALLVFDQFDQDRDGILSPEELTRFFTYASRKVLWSPGLAEVLTSVEAGYAAAAAPGAGCTRDAFVRLIRTQVAVVSASPAYQASAMRADEAARLAALKGIGRQELCAARWVFGLLDFDGDGKLALSDLERAGGIEEIVFAQKLEDADADDDGLLLFEEWVDSYARPKPVARNVAIMLVNTCIIWFLLQAPLSPMIKVCAVGLLVLRPQIVSRPVLAVFDALEGLLGGAKARVAVASAG